MASSPNGNGNLLGFGVLERECNVVLVLGLYDQLRLNQGKCQPHNPNVIHGKYAMDAELERSHEVE